MKTNVFLNVKKLPKKINEINYFKKQINEKGCTLISFSEKKNITILCRLEEFEIENDFCVDDKTLNMIRLLAPIERIEFSENKIIIKSEKGNYCAKLIDKTFPQIETDYLGKIDVEIKNLNIAKSFLSNYELHSPLSGIKINSCGDIVATDRYSAFRKVNDKNKDSREKSTYIVVSKDFTDFIEKEFAKDEIVTLYYDKNKCMIKKDNLIYIGRLIAGNFPNIDYLFDNLGGEELIIDFEDLKEKINLAKGVGDDENKMILYTFDNGKLIVNGENNFQTEISGNLKNVEHNFTLNLENLYKIINSVECEKLTLYYNSQNKPIFIKDNGKEILVLPIIRN